MPPQEVVIVDDYSNEEIEIIKTKKRIDSDDLAKKMFDRVDKKFKKHTSQRCVLWLN